MTEIAQVLYCMEQAYPVGKIAEKRVCRSVFLTTWHCILIAKLTKKDCFLVILPTGYQQAILLSRIPF